MILYHNSFFPTENLIAILILQRYIIVTDVIENSLDFSEDQIITKKIIVIQQNAAALINKKKKDVRDYLNQNYRNQINRQTGIIFRVASSFSRSGV